jgi:hypothetical protein
MERFSLAGSGGGDRAAADRLAALDAHLAQLQAQQKARVPFITFCVSKTLKAPYITAGSHLIGQHLMLMHTLVAAWISTLAALRVCLSIRWFASEHATAEFIPLCLHSSNWANKRQCCTALLVLIVAQS